MQVGLGKDGGRKRKREEVLNCIMVCGWVCVCVCVGVGGCVGVWVWVWVCTLGNGLKNAPKPAKPLSGENKL